MNWVLIVSDTLRWDYLGFSGNNWIETPNLDELAAESAVFVDAYGEGLPTLPARRAILTGRPVTPARHIHQPSDAVGNYGWHPLCEQDVSAAEWLGEKEMLLYYNAFMRGAARAWEKDWGISIYGQADTAVSPLAVTLAYDLGARYIWYWTSDHGHHLPYREQLDLTRHLRAHQKAHPRKSRKQLLRAAKVAIALPQGYVIDFGFGPLWASNDFAMDKLNDKGVPYGDVVKAAVKEAIGCLKKGESFDFIVNSRDFQPSGYDRIVHIRLDGTVETAQD